MTRKLLILLIAALGLLDSNIFGQGVEGGSIGGSSSGGGDGTVTDCTKSTGQPLTCPDGFSTGTGGTNPRVELSGLTSGLAVIKAPDVAGTPTFRLPGTVSDTLMGRLTPVSVTQLPVLAPFGGYGLTGAVYKQAFASNAISGTTDLYTAPALKRALVLVAGIYNPSAGTIARSFSVKISGTYYRITSNANISTLAQATSTLLFVLEPGESVAVITNAIGLNCWVRIVEYDSSNALFSPRLLTVASGNNTLYTVPASTSSIILPVSQEMTLGTMGGVFLSNETGGARAVKLFVVPSGGSTATTNQLYNNAALSTPFAGAVNGPQVMSTGDFVVYNTDAATAGQVIWMNVFER